MDKIKHFPVDRKDVITFLGKTDASSNELFVWNFFVNSKEKSFWFCSMTR